MCQVTGHDTLLLPHYLALILCQYALVAQLVSQDSFLVMWDHLCLCPPKVTKLDFCVELEILQSSKFMSKAMIYKYALGEYKVKFDKEIFKISISSW